jgi:hypothetical protein
MKSLDRIKALRQYCDIRRHVIAAATVAPGLDRLTNVSQLSELGNLVIP